MKTIEIDGEQFELFKIEENSLAPVGTYVLRPVEPEPKYEVNLYKSGLEGRERCIDVTLNCSQETAETIKEFISAGMEYIYSDTPFKGELVNRARHARIAVLEEKAS